VARAPVGSWLLAQLKAVVRSVALTAGGARPSLNEHSIASLFNMSASSIAIQRLYDGGLSLPFNLPWPRARALVSALLEGLNAARTTELGARVGELLMRQPAVPLDAAAQADVGELIAVVESAMRARLGGSAAGGSRSSGGDGSSAASARSTPPPGSMPVAVAVEVPSHVDAASTLSVNARRLVQGGLSRAMLEAETAQLDAALSEALSLLQAGGEEGRRRLLGETMAVALLTPGAAQLWASIVEAVDGGVPSVAAVCNSLVDHASAVAGVLFARAVV
jgi:hypothetical protein